MTDILGYCYGLTVFAGGLIGYLKAGSVPSLSAGLVFGVLAGIGAYRVSNDNKNVTMSIIVCLVLLVIMGKKYYGGGKFIPAGAVSMMSLLMVLRYAARLI